MQIKIFTVPVISGEQINEELNKFLRSQKIVDIEKQLVMQKECAFWSFCVTYLPVARLLGEDSVERREKIDYKRVLDEPTFAIFTRLRAIRKQLADRDAVPAYAVFTDAELAEIAKMDMPTPSQLRSVPGIGERKVEKYGVDLCAMLTNEKSGLSD